MSIKKIRKLILPILAIFGILFTLFMIFRGAKKAPAGPVVFAPPESPYKHHVAGIGVIESVYKNIPLGIPFVDIITHVYVRVGDVVQKNAPLFTLDTRAFDAQMQESLQTLRYAQINFEDKKTQYSFYERLKNRSAVSEQEYTRAFYQMELAQQQVATAQEAVNVIKTNIERSTVLSPIDGEVLQLNVRPGQLATADGYAGEPLILFGDTKYYHLRVDIDEEDAWRIVKGSPAQAYVRGNATITFPLEYVYTEPYIVPKKVLTGANSERVDTRVLQVVYRFEKDTYPIYAGEILDVYIEALPNEGSLCI